MQRTCLSTHDCLKIVLDALVNKSVEVIRRRRGIGCIFVMLIQNLQRPTSYTIVVVHFVTVSPRLLNWIFVTLPGEPITDTDSSNDNNNQPLFNHHHHHHHHHHHDFTN